MESSEKPPVSHDGSGSRKRKRPFQGLSAPLSPSRETSVYYRAKGSILYAGLVFVLLTTGLTAGQTCAQCHPKATTKCRQSPHYTLTNAINITRKVWGITDSNVTLQSLPLPKKSVNTPADLVDDFLRRKCLKCHVFNRSSGEKGMTRGTGCLACHTPHRSSGSCQRAPVATGRCQSCHNKGYTGGEYDGRFPKDHHRSYRAPLTSEGHFPPQKYGIDFHRLSEDVHHQKGIRCAECHTAQTLRGEAKSRCTDCHKTPSAKNHPDYHARIACIACHASWGYSAYELSVFRDDTPDYTPWKDLTLQEDGYLTRFLARALKSSRPIPPRMPDWLTRTMRPGLWYSGYRYKRWEDSVLANYDDGRIGLVRPLYQYRISYRDRNGTMILDDVHTQNGHPIETWLPYAPHTITRRAKSCEQCHANPLILSPYRGNHAVLGLKVPKRMIGAAPLSRQQIERMQSIRYRRERFRRF